MWNPIIERALRAEIFKMIESIAAAIQKAAGPKVGDGKSKSSKPRRNSRGDAGGSDVSRARAVARDKTDPSLSSGSAGLAILFAYLDQARSGYGDRQTALYFLEQSMDAVAAVPMSPSLYTGVTGVAWTMAHLRGTLFEPDDDATDAIDTLLKDGLSRVPWRDSYDLIEGLVGFGIYALEQLPRSVASECLAHVVDRLDEIAERTPAGITWFTSPELLPDWQRELFPSGYYNLGVAHGVPGVIAFLAQVYALDERKVSGVTKVRTKARPLLEGAVAWLLAQKRPGNADSFFSNWIGPGIPRTSSRVAWCYGDLGIATALLAAASSLRNANWNHEAVRIARHSAERSFERSGARDCGLCHGAAGVGHLFNRMFQATGDFQLRDAARGWFRHTLKMRQPERGVAGFTAFQLDHGRDEVGILEGAAGIALALLAGVTPIEPRWDRMLLISSPLHVR